MENRIVAKKSTSSAILLALLILPLTALPLFLLPLPLKASGATRLGLEPSGEAVPVTDDEEVKPGEKIEDLPDVQVTHIKFNHRGPSSKGAVVLENTTDGLFLQKSFGVNFDHNNHSGDGEWVKKLSRNEPALYVAKVTPTIKVRLEIPASEKQKTLTIFALSKNLIVFSPTQVGPFEVPIPILNNLDVPNVTPNDVTFNKQGVSIGANKSEYVEFTLSGPMRDTIAKTSLKLKWFVLQETEEGEEQEPTLFEETGPHIIYTVHDRPQKPWNGRVSNQRPWVSALEFSINEVRTRFQTDEVSIAQRVTLFVYKEHGLKYNTTDGRSAYIETGRRFDFSKFINKSKQNVVNCDDVALAVCAIASLIGLESRYVDIQAFGYVKRGSLIGFKKQINSALNTNSSGLDTCVHGSRPNVNCDDDIIYDKPPHQRFPFVRHAIAKISSAPGASLYYDGCLGTKDLLPVMKATDEEDYLGKTQDLSTLAEKDGKNNPRGRKRIPTPPGTKADFLPKNYSLR